MKVLEFILFSLLLCTCANSEEHSRLARATSPHAKLVKLYEPKIRLLKTKINAAAINAERQIDSAISSISSTVSSAVKGVNTAINQKRNGISIELFYLPNTSQNDKLRKCLKQNLNTVDEQSGSIITDCNPDSTIFNNLYKKLNSIYSLSSNLNQLTFRCTVFYPSSSQASKVEKCLNDGINNAEQNYLKSSNDITTTIGSTKTNVDNCVKEKKKDIYDVLNKLVCWIVDPATTQKSASTLTIADLTTTAKTKTTEGSLTLSTGKPGSSSTLKTVTTGQTDGPETKSTETTPNSVKSSSPKTVSTEKKDGPETKSTETTPNSVKSSSPNTVSTEKKDEPETKSTETTPNSVQSSSPKTVTTEKKDGPETKSTETTPNSV